MKNLYQLFLQWTKPRNIVIITGIGFLALAFSCREKDQDEFIALNIHAVQPDQVYIGDTLTIIGEGFSPGYKYNRVSFTGADDEVIPLEESTTKKLIIPLPDGTQSGPVTVNILDQETGESPALTVYMPVIQKMEPDQAWRGDTVTLTGENFQLNKDRNHVSFHSVFFANVIEATREQLKVVIPYFAAESGHVKVMGFQGPEFMVKPSEISSIVPDHGAAGDTVTIHGLGLVSDPDIKDNVIFKDSKRGKIVADRSTSHKVTVIVPEGSSDGPLSYEILNGPTVTGTQIFQVFPSITEVSPLNGEAGIEVTILGYSFSKVTNENVVTFNGIQGEVTSATDRELHAVVPSGVSSGRISLAVNGRGADGPDFEVTAPGTPIVLNISPKNGPVGSNVVINGKYFNPASSSNAVRIGNAQATVLSGSDTQLTIKVPVGAISGTLTVTNNGETGIGPAFTVTEGSAAIPFISGISPAQAPTGSAITVRGGNFSTDIQELSLRVSPGNFTVVSATTGTITATVPATYIPGDYLVYVSQGGNNSNAVAFTVSGQPHIDALSATEGTPGTVLTITGTQLHSTEIKNTVKFGSTGASFVDPGDAVPSTVKVYVPDVAPGSYEVTLSAFGNTSNAFRFEVKPKPVAIKNIYVAVQSQGRTRILKMTPDLPSPSVIYESPLYYTSIAALNVDFASQKVYFIEGGQLKRSNLDNSGVETLYSVGDACDVSLDVAHNRIFWTGEDFASVYSASMDGGGTPRVIYSLNNGDVGYISFGITYEPAEDMLYMIEYDAETFVPRVIRAKPDGSGQIEVVANQFTDADYLLDVKPDVGHHQLFIVNDQRIFSVDLDGPGNPKLMQEVSGLVGMALDTRSTFLYWARNNSNTAEVYRQTYDGSEIGGTDPASDIQKVYDISGLISQGNTPVGLVVEEADATAAVKTRSATVSFATLKIPVMQKSRLLKLMKSKK